MTAKRYLIDENGLKTDLVISIKHEEKLEDFFDALTIEERADEESIPFEEFVPQLKAERKLDE